MDYTLLAVQFKKELKAQLENELEPQFLSSFVENATSSQTWLDLNRRIVASMYAALELDELTQEEESVKEPKPLLPGLIIYTCGAVGGTPERAVPAAAAVEFLLRASCLLDDIQDQDRPDALAAKLGVTEALNTALIMIQVGQANLVSALTTAGLPADLSLELFSELSHTIINAAKGQLLDLTEVNCSLHRQLNSPDYFLKKAALKTAETVGFLTYLGAVIGAGAKTEYTGLYRAFGLYFGMVLHLVNDLKDFVLGLENAGRDLKNRHLTLPVVYCYQELTSIEDKATLLKLWSSPGSSEANHQKLLDLLKSKFAVPQVLGQATMYMAQAESVLKQLDPGLEKIEHRLMLASLENLLGQFRYYFSRFNGLKA